MDVPHCSSAPSPALGPCIVVREKKNQRIIKKLKKMPGSYTVGKTIILREVE